MDEFDTVDHTIERMIAINDHSIMLFSSKITSRLIRKLTDGKITYTYGNGRIALYTQNGVEYYLTDALDSAEGGG